MDSFHLQQGNLLVDAHTRVLLELAQPNIFLLEFLDGHEVLLHSIVSLSAGLFF